MTLNLASASCAHEPFAHFKALGALDAATGGAALVWLRDEADWRLRVEDFYEQHEISLLDQPPTGKAAILVSPTFVDACRTAFRDRMPHADCLELVGICAHRLTAGQTIRVHNDYIGEGESHRLLLQLNQGWKIEQGGLLMLFGDDNPESLTDVVSPDHLSCFGFEISARSHHAVSTIRSGERFTVVYTFRRPPC